jgi:hypothetical protein
MKPILHHLIKFAFLVLMVNFPLDTRALSPAQIHLEGYAKLGVHFHHQDLIGYTMEVSGDESPCLIVYNLRKHKVEWRRELTNTYATVYVSPDGTLYLLDKNYLYQLNIDNGKMLCDTDLNKLPWPQKSLPKHDIILKLEAAEAELSQKIPTDEEKMELARLRECIRELNARLVWETEYTIQQLSPSNFYIQRTLNRRLGCIGDMHANYIIRDFYKNSTLQSGFMGEVISRLSPEESILLEYCLESDDKLLRIKNGVTRDIGTLLSKDRPRWKLGHESRGYSRGLSHDKRCLINYEQYIESDNAVDENSKEDDTIFKGNATNLKEDNKYHYALYDSRTELFTYLDLDRTNKHYTSLVLQSTNVIRYSTSISYESKTNPSTLWIESYDFNGKRTAHMTLSGTITEDRRLWFLGRTTKDDLVFEDFISYGSAGSKDPYTVTGRVFVVESPSLKIKAQHQLPVCIGGMNITLVPNMDQIVQVDGNIDLETMKNPSQPHQFIVRGIDVYSGKELWRFTEDVTIRKLKSE